MATFITDAVLKTFVAGVLKKPEDDLNNTTYWNGTITIANQSATDEIKGRLAARGFTTAQIAAWDRVEEFNKWIGAYNALVAGGALESYDDRYVERFKRWLDELDTVAVLNNGTLQASQDIAEGPVNTEEDLFVMDDEDPRRGEVTRF